MTAPPPPAKPGSPGVAFPAVIGVAELAARFGGQPDEAACALRVGSVCSPEQAVVDRELGASSLVLVTAARWLDFARASRGVLLCSEALAPRLPSGRRWPHPAPLWVVAQLLGAPEPDRGVIDATAVVDRRAELAPGVSVRAGAVIHAGVRIGPDGVIGEHAVIYGGVSIGARARVGAQAVLGREGFGWATSPSGELCRVPQRGGVRIGDDVEIGPFCSVDAGTLGPTMIMDRVRLDAHVHVGHNAVIGSDTLVAAQAGFAGSVRLGRGVLVGGQAGCADHVSIGDGARIAAQSGVIGHVPAGAEVAGFPAVRKARLFRALALLLRQGIRAGTHEQRDPGNP